MTNVDHLLVILGEECAEVAQRTSKAIRFGLFEVQPGQTEDNKTRIERELSDLMAVADMLGFKVSEEQMEEKRAKVRKFMAYARECGQLHDSQVSQEKNQ